ncbi:hypothetical protein, partial [uncultured Treponema sp.]|uniref:hypothetical protein n=1 Tax=uncultured Treponema sp. TaxID=162155 RepID=UPI0025EC5F24
MKLDYTIDKKPSVSPETRINMQMRLNERLARLYHLPKTEGGFSFCRSLFSSVPEFSENTQG